MTPAGLRYDRRTFLALAGAPAGSPSLAGLDPTRYDRRVASDVRQRLLSRWREVTGRT